MKNLGRTRKMAAACAAGSGLLLAAWSGWRGWASAAAPGAAPAALLASLPKGADGSAADRAVARWAENARLKPGDAGAWAGLGDALMQKARDTADAGYYRHAEQVYRRGLEINPKHPGATTGIAWVHGARHEFERSIEWAKRAIALEPRNPEAHGLLGDAAVELGDYDGAFQQYQKMLDLRPDLGSYSRGAHLLFLTGNTRKAIWLMGKAVEASAPYPENTAWCRAQLALMLWNTGARPAAEQLLSEALRTAPKNPHLQAAMGRVKASQNDYPGAIDCYRQAVAIVPQHESLVALGDLYALTGNRAEAEKQFAVVEALHRLNQANGVRGDMQLAQFYADHDRKLPDALRQAEAEYAARKSVFAADTLAWCYYKNGRLAEAKEMIRKALSRNTPEARFHYHAGMIYAKAGERAPAQHHLYQAMSLNSSFSPVDGPIAAATFKQLGARKTL